MVIQQKYIRTQENEIVFFPMGIEHSNFIAFKPISAGFCVIEDNMVTCLGESFSLSINSKADDSEIATLQVFGMEQAIKVQNS